jgi:hypothetical protein
LIGLAVGILVTLVVLAFFVERALLMMFEEFQYGK